MQLHSPAEEEDPPNRSTSPAPTPANSEGAWPVVRVIRVRARGVPATCSPHAALRPRHATRGQSHGACAAVSGRSGTTDRWRRCVVDLRQQGENINITWSPDGKYLAVGSRDDQIRYDLTALCRRMYSPDSSMGLLQRTAVHRLTHLLAPPHTAFWTRAR
jgi:hypothetical protein